MISSSIAARFVRGSACRCGCERVDARHAPGQSPEEAARSARYDALRLWRRCEAQAAIQHIALAQHADDQVETLLLALSRGAGLPGLSAMPAQWERDGIHYYRPLLGVQRRLTCGAGLQARGVAWIEDPTNADEQYTRNRIRARLLPALEATFPAVSRYLCPQRRPRRAGAAPAG